MRREIVEELEKVKRELGAESLGDAISQLIRSWRMKRALELAEKVEEARKKGGFSELRKVVEEAKKLKWLRYT
ncbi:MAG: hypothetical protein DRJ55_03535 [Thermoprotei archaeon]|nr:MAG: hypothetical protein DRJ46_00825 [Thermoprotei archaeon]RLE93602.1 MAG: hypothetical protein DRJ55_03535 [Thermoprotei archaeon]